MFTGFCFDSDLNFVEIFVLLFVIFFDFLAF